MLTNELLALKKWLDLLTIVDDRQKKSTDAEMLGLNMNCQNPIRLADSLRPPVPCSYCPACVSRKKKEWRTRILLEYDTGNKFYPADYLFHGFKKQASFVTLTYEQSQLPETNLFSTGNVSKDDIFGFIKRFRQNYQNHYGEREIKYYLTAEYGSPQNSLRPHYHLIFFNMDAVRSEKITKLSWTKGFIRVDQFESKHASYVAGYTLKKLKKSQLLDGQKPEFQTRSNGLGINALPKVLKAILKHNKFPSKSISMIDRYLIETSSIQQQLNIKTQEDNLFLGVLVRYELNGTLQYQLPLMSMDSPQFMTLFKDQDGKPKPGVTALTFDKYLQTKLFYLAYPDLKKLLDRQKNILNLKHARHVDGNYKIIPKDDLPNDSAIKNSKAYQSWLYNYSANLHNEFDDYLKSDEQKQDQLVLEKRQRAIDRAKPTH